jgi:thioredoxin 1
MNKIILGLIAVVVIGLIVYSVGGSDEAAMMMEGEGDAMMQKEEGAMMEKEAEKVMMQKEEGAMMEKEAEEVMMKKEEGAMMEGEAMMEAEGAMMMESEEGAMMESEAGRYEVYASEKLASSQDVVLFFKASWCPKCKALDADIKSRLGNIPADLTILEVDYDNSAELKKKYGVTYQHTFVQVDKAGNLIKKWSGSADLAALVAQVN